MLVPNEYFDRTSIGRLYRVLKRFRFSNANALKLAIAVGFPTSQGSVERQTSNKLCFFFPSTGRSGSKLLAELLGKSNNAIVSHEPVSGEASAYVDTFRDPLAADAYFRDFRVRYIYFLLRRRNEPIYGETNGNLRRHIDAIQAHLPNSLIIQLVRHPADVVTSVMNRDAFMDAHPYLKPSFRFSTQLSSEEWQTMTRLEKVAWVWREDNEFIRKRTESYVRMEDIVSQYDYFHDYIQSPIGVDLSMSDWALGTQKRVNIGKRGEFPEYSEWSLEEKRSFERICGPEMHNYGY